MPERTPNTAKPSAAQTIKSFIRKILLASPDFPRFYADVVIASAPNSFDAKILAQSYEKIVAYTERTKLMSNPKSCTHIKVSGVRCGSPALRGEQFCYFHQRMLRSVRMPAQSRLHPIALIEDANSIQASLMEVINALMRNTIDLKRATLILRALHIAAKNAAHVRLALEGERAVKEIPDYPAPPAPDPRSIPPHWSANLTPEETLNKIRTQPQAETAAVDVVASATGYVDTAVTGHVGTAALGCPSGPDSPGRSALESTNTPNAHRKPPASAKAAGTQEDVQPPKLRKSAAHATGGSARSGG